MSKEEKNVLAIKSIQYLIYGVSLIFAFLNRETTQDWPVYLLLMAVVIGNRPQRKFRSSALSTRPGLFLKHHTRRLETIIDRTIGVIVILLVFGLTLFY